jgi:hypothetical protein
MSRGLSPSWPHSIPGLGRSQPVMVVTSASLSVMLLPLRSLASLLPQGGVSAEDMNLFIMVQSLSLCLMGYGW